MSHPAQHGDTVRTVLMIALGVVVAITVLAALASGGDEPGYGGAGYGGSDYGDQGSGGSTSFYDGGSITTTEDGELIYSDADGNSFSTGG
jgi:hypothetical protein